jgi:uncharacterized protein (DUF924 family)
MDNVAIGPADVLEFWFGDAVSPRSEWFRKDAAFDATIAARFGPTIERALAGGLDGWNASEQSQLAHVIVLDQFTRNVFRDTACAFAGDDRALALARDLVARGADRLLTPLQRWFAYLPFEHAEDIAAQTESLRLFDALAREAPALADAATWARRHQEVIARFGRYPHRNTVLGRASTAEELLYLQQPGSGF